MGFGSYGDNAQRFFGGGRKKNKRSIGISEIPLDLKLSKKDIEALSQAGKFGVGNTVKAVAKYAMRPAREDARKLSAVGIRGKERKGTVKGLRGVKDTYSLRVYNKKGESKTVRKKVLAYRAGVKKAGAYLERGRFNAAGGVTLMLSIKKNADYYNFVANFWEHGWTANGTRVRGNQFMTKAVERNTSVIGNRFAAAVRKGVEVSPARLTAKDLKGLT